MGIFSIFRRRQPDDEATRRQRLLKTGRIADGIVMDIATDEAGLIRNIYFSYTISGVDYESSQTLDEEQRRRQADYAPGARVTVRYHPGQPGNSTVV